MKLGADAAWEAWATLGGLAREQQVQVFVDPTSALGPDGWVAILAIGEHMAAAVPTAGLVQPVRAALAGLTSQEAVAPATIVPRLPPAATTLGPAHLYYPPEGFALPDRAADVATTDELAALASHAARTDLDESGIEKIQSPCFVSRDADGVVAAACGYRRWPNGVAHLSVLTHPLQRQRGHGQSAAEGAIRHALSRNLLPQWRARFEPSMGLATSLGLIRVGANFSMNPA